MSLVKNTTRSLRAGFSPVIIERAAAILAGNISATWYVDQIGSRIPMLHSNPIFEIGALLALSGANAFVVGKFISKKHAADILTGGILAAVTRTAKMVLPGSFSTCGLGEDLEGMSGLAGWFANPNNIGQAFQLAGYGSPSQPLIGTHGLGDEAMYHQVQPQNVVTLDGMAAMAEMEREIAQQM